MRRALLLLMILAACSHDAKGRFDDLVASERFRTSEDATGALATLSQQVIEESRACVKERGRSHRRCEARGVAAAWLQVAAVEAPHCSRAELSEIRGHLVTLLDQVDAVDEGRRRALPKLPPTPDC